MSQEENKIKEVTKMVNQLNIENKELKDLLPDLVRKMALVD